MGYHFVPQRYLRRFQDPCDPGRLWLHVKATRTSRPAAIRALAQAKNFYPEETERRLASRVESPANAVIEKLLVGSVITQAERGLLAVFVGTMACRVPAHRDRTRSMVPEVLAHVVDGVRQMMREAHAEGTISEALFERRLEEVAAAEAKFASTPPQEVIDRIVSPWPSVQIVNLIREMAWRVLRTSGPQLFVTSDNPVFKFPCKGYGWGTPHGELCLPLSTTHALHGSWQGRRNSLQYVMASQRIVREINKRTVSAADRFVFAHCDARWILELMRKRLVAAVLPWPNAPLIEPPHFDDFGTMTHPLGRPEGVTDSVPS